MGQERRRTVLMTGGLFEDPAEEGRFIETFRSDSWARSSATTPARVTEADRILEQEVRPLSDWPRAENHAF